MQINGIQFLRFIAVFLVVGSHIVLEIWRRIANDGRFHFWHDFGGAGVDIFFVISGFVITISIAKLAASGGAAAAWLFCKRRLIRIVPMYWLYSAVKAALIILVGSKAFGSTVDPLFFLSSILFVPTVNPAGDRLPVLESGWTLSFEMLFYATFALAVLLRRPPLRFSLIALGAMFLAGRYWHDILFLDFFARTVLFEFLLGGLIARLWIRKTALHPALAPALIVVSVLALFSPRSGLDRLLATGLPSALLVMGMVWMERYRWVSRVTGYFKLPGDASYSIYLSHGLIVPVFIIAAQKTGMTHTAAAFTFAMAGALGLGCLLYLWVEKPVTDWLNRRFGAGKAKPDLPPGLAGRPLAGQ